MQPCYLRTSEEKIFIYLSLLKEEKNEENNMAKEKVGKIELATKLFKEGKSLAQVVARLIQSCAARGGGKLSAETAENTARWAASKAGISLKAAPKKKAAKSKAEPEAAPETAAE